jgi:hypothetical protein
MSGAKWGTKLRTYSYSRNFALRRNKDYVINPSSVKDGPAEMVCVMMLQAFQRDIERYDLLFR